MTDADEYQGHVAHYEIDITGELCPMTVVRTRLALDRMQPGQLLGVRLRGEEPRRMVPAQAAALGHRVAAAEEQADGALRLLILKGDGGRGGG